MGTYANPATLRLLKIPAGRSARVGGLLTVDKISASALAKLKVLLDISDSQLALLVGIPERSYHRQKSSKAALKPAQADSALRVGRILQEASAVFGELGKATLWLKTKHPVLGSLPIELIGSDAGAQAVLDELTRVRWGDVA